MIKSHDYSVFNWGTMSLFSKVATLFYISSSSSWELQFPYILSSICYCHLFISHFFFFLILGTILRTVLKRLGRRILPCAWYLCTLSHFSHVWLFATLWTVAHQAPLSKGFSRQEYWNGLPFPPLGDFPNPGTELVSLTSPALAGRFFTTSTM